MKANIILYLLLSLFFCNGFSSCGTESKIVKHPQEYNVDICIYGATSAGVIAAYAAHKLGKTVLLVGPEQIMGGLTTGGLGHTDAGKEHAIKGLSRKFYEDIGKKYGITGGSLSFEPHVALEVFQNYMEESGVEVMLKKKLNKIEKKRTEIQYILLDEASGDKVNPIKIKAKEFLDCTYEGDLMAMAGVSFATGREGNAKYKETYNGFQLPEYHKQSGFHQFPDGVSPYVVPGNPSSGLVWGISTNKPAPTGTGDKLIQAYNFRICLTDDPANRIPITRPADYDSTRYELMVRLFNAQPYMRNINDYFIWSPMPNHKTDVNNRGAFSTDLIGMNQNWPEATYEERQKLTQKGISLTKGLLYFMKTDKRVPDTLQEFVQNWGYPKDEYQQFGHFTPQIYVREGRRMIGEYVMTEHNCMGEETVHDGIGLASYTMDSHNCQRIVIDGMVKNEGNVEVKVPHPYPVSYRSITPKRTECTNLLTPVCLSASHIAFGSIRMEPVFMILGQSAAMAASIAIDEKSSVQNIDVNKLQLKLKNDPYLTE